MTIVQQIAAYIAKKDFADMSEQAGRQIKLRILDSLGTAIGAVQGPPVRMLRNHIEEFSSAGACTLLGGGRAAPDDAALYNSALVRYLDYNDSYLAKGETCHPSDNLGAVLAAAEQAGASGRQVMLALAVAYQVQCRLSDEAPVRAKGFDHTTQGAYAVAAGVSKALGLTSEKTANALAISGTALNALRVTRTGALSHWKGLAYPYTAFGATAATYLARQGITGPMAVFEGNKGFQESIAGPFKIDWEHEDLERVTRTIIKKYNAEVHSQATLEGVLALQRQAGFNADQVEKIEIVTFDVAYHIIGGGEEGDKTAAIHTKEEADHSLQYMTAVALLDGQVLPAQYEPERIRRTDVQALLRKISVQPSEAYSARFPAEMPCHVKIHLRDDRTLEIEKTDYEGFHSRPMDWTTACEKFESLAAPYADADVRGRIIDTVQFLEKHDARALAGLISQVRIPG
ncbi:MAG: 2-methylcitrate dehydratase [Desulfatitalea sp. BRH_c12]|nr:MAG: 2-methylcitrate dehydratase [Desulfatitalea sp. BRH_c12]